MTLIGPSGADGFIAGVAAAFQGRSTRVHRGLTNGAAPPSRQATARAGGDRIEVAVVGAHLSGLPLNRELIELGASFSREVETTQDYRLFALPWVHSGQAGTIAGRGRRRRGDQG